jgi:hypothetical protein
MKIASALVSATVLVSSLVLAVAAADARPHHPHCSWVMRHHHKVKVCR